MATHSFTVKITTGKRTPVEVSALSFSYNGKEMAFEETNSTMHDSKMEELIEASIEKSIGAWIDSENYRLRTDG